MNCFVWNHLFFCCWKLQKLTFTGCPRNFYHRFTYIAPSSGHSLLNLNMPFTLILRRFDVVSYVWSRAANLSLSKKIIIELKKTNFEVKKVFLRAERASWARSAKSFRPGSRARVRALEAHGFRCSLVQS